jgi:phosphopantothenate-cysteine ligase/phosphopantothenoylcysteine decarboxylase/phosphopantothenate--cysteine ligase
MKNAVLDHHFDIIIHSAAVSDYEVEEILQQTGVGPLFQFLQKLFNYLSLINLLPIDRSKKISSSHQALYIKMKQTPKIVDQIRSWGFTGKLIKFKLQVDMTAEELIQVAERSRIQSKADAIVANCLEWAREKAYIIAGENSLITKRDKLPQNLESFIETYL